MLLHEKEKMTGELRKCSSVGCIDKMFHYCWPASRVATVCHQRETSFYLRGRWNGNYHFYLWLVCTIHNNGIFVKNFQAEGSIFVRSYFSKDNRLNIKRSHLYLFIILL